MPAITVTGQVSTVANDKYNYVKLWETYDFKGTAKYRHWTAWLDRDLNLNEGDTIEVTGDLSTKVDTYTPKDATEQKQIVAHALNNCTVKVLKQAEKKTGDLPPLEVANATDLIDMPF